MSSLRSLLLTLTLLSPSLLVACKGLDYLGTDVQPSDDTQPLGDDSLSEGDSDTDSDSDSDTDSDSDSDTDSDTDTDVEQGPSIDGLDPEYGTNGGGVEVLITGGPFDSSSTVTFGSSAATITNRGTSVLTVLTPKTAVTGAVDVTVSNKDGESVQKGGFTLYEDATGTAALFGVMEWYGYTGGYWGGSSPGFGNAAVSLIEPADIHYWDLYASSDDACASTFTSSVSIYVYDLSVSQITLAGSTTSMKLAWDSTALQWSTEPTAAQFKFDDYWSINPISSSSLPTFEVEDAARTMNSFTITSPNISTSSTSPPNLAKSDLIMKWSGTSGDRMLIYLVLTTDGDWANVVEEVSCVALNDGNFTVPSSVFKKWSSGKVLYILMGDTKDGGGGVFPVNNGDSRVAGIYWMIGAAITK